MITARESAEASVQAFTDEQFAQRTFARVKWKILPLLMICYVLALIDRNVIGFAKLGFMVDLGFREVVYGIGAGIFFVGYILFEIPSNLMLQRIGFRKTVLRIMIMWGLACAAFAMMTSETMFYTLRFMLGVAEAGFFPGVLLFLTLWIPRNRRASVTAMFMAAIPISGMIGGPLAGEMAGMKGGAEFVGTSISSNGDQDQAAFHAQWDPLKADNPHWKLIDAHRGYHLFDIRRDGIDARVRVVDTVGAGDGFAASRSGPTVPVAPASARVWQAPHPAEAKTCLPTAVFTGVVGAAAPSSARSTQKASATKATAPATGIHQCVRPVCRRLKKSRAHAPIAIRAIRTNQA